MSSSTSGSVVLYRGTAETILQHAVQHARMRQYRPFMPKRLTALVEQSLRLIERGNRLHARDTPAAVILQAAHDHNAMFANKMWLAQLEKLTKTYYIALHIIGDNEELASTIHAMKQEVGARRIMTAIIRAHGITDTDTSEYCLQFGTSYYYTTPQASDFADIDLSGSIILEACRSGNSLAEQIASLQPRSVFAPPHTFYLSCYVPCCATHGMGIFAFDTANTMAVKRFSQQSGIVTRTSLCSATTANIEQALQILRQHAIVAAQQGNANAQDMLGHAYKDGGWVPQSHEIAVEWYRKAAEQGFVTAQYNIAAAYRDGLGVAQSHALSYDWYRKAAEQGCVNAQSELGIVYWDGRGITTCYERAVFWFKEAAAQSDAVAQTNLGMAYTHGFGVPQSHVRGVEWYRKAAEHGYEEAQYALGDAYVNGQGVAQSNADAVYWYKKAAAQGHAGAEQALREIVIP